ncbi:protein LURP-one-related 6-like [Aristolochia californica]|uniref:protein LURP-one-related 6-like n=1 Tax=Aristolochia californica TaxID=171875 RepID=UPI0035DB0F98
MSVVASGSRVPIVSKIYCSSSPLVFFVRNRPHAVNGGGFVVTNCRQEVVFRVDGCGTLGTEGKLILRDGDGAPLLVIIRRKGGVVQALSSSKLWKGYTQEEEEGAEKLVFSLKEPSAWSIKSKITVSIEPHGRGWDFEVKGSFVSRNCCISDRRGNVAAQVGIVEVKELLRSKDVYHVVVQPGADQAFVFGIIAVLDNIYGQSTAC